MRIALAIGEVLLGPWLPITVVCRQNPPKSARAECWGGGRFGSAHARGPCDVAAVVLLRGRGRKLAKTQFDLTKERAALSSYVRVLVGIIR